MEAPHRLLPPSPPAPLARAGTLHCVPAGLLAPSRERLPQRVPPRGVGGQWELGASSGALCLFTKRKRCGLRTHRGGTLSWTCHPGFSLCGGREEGKERMRMSFFPTLSSFRNPGSGRRRHSGRSSPAHLLGVSTPLRL